VLPCPIDEAKVSASLNDGVLTITMPKASEAKSTHITVK
jgi:HSP20 family protein